MIKTLIVASAAVLALAACDNNSAPVANQDSAAGDTAMENAAMENAAMENAAMANTAMQNGTAGAAIADAPASSMDFSALDTAFVEETARLNHYELQAADLAAKMSPTPAVKDYAAMITKHHTMAGKELKATIAEVAPSTTLPTGVGPKGEARLDALRTAGANFDELYKQQMIDSHAEIYAFFADYADNGAANTMVRGFAKGLNPIVKLHWDRAKKL